MRKRNRNSAVSLTYFLYFASLGAFMPYISLYLGESGWSGAHIGLYTAIGPLVTFLTQPLWGYFGDLWDDLPKLCSLLALGAGASALAFAFLPVSPLFFLLAILIGLFQGPISPMLDSMSVRILDTNRNQWGVTRLWGSIGFAIVSLAMGGIFVQSKVMLFVGYALGITLTAAAVLRLQSRPRQNSNAPALRRLELTGLTNILKGPFIPFLAAVFLLQLGHNIPNNFLSLVMADRGASGTLIGLAWSITALVEIPVFIGTIKLLNKFRPERLLIWAGLLTAFRLALFAFTFNPLLMLLVHALKGFTFATILTALVLMVDRLVPVDYHATGFTLNTAFSVTLPQLIGGLVGGYIYDLSGGTGVFLASSSLALLGTLAFIGWHTKLRQTQVKTNVPNFPGT